MAESLDALNFNAIIDDKEFKASVDRIIGEAQRLNTDVSKILTFNAKIQSKQIITSQGVKNAEAMVGHLKDIEEKMTALSGKKLLVGDADALNETLQKVLEKMDDFSDKSEKSKGSIKGINNELNKSQGLMQTLAQLTGVTFGLAGIRSFLSGLVRVTGEFEVQKMALTSMLQDAGKAEEIFSTLRQKALESPYTFQDLTKYAKQLTAFNIDADKLVETEKRLADVSAGLGVDMGRIILAYGQVKAAGVLKGTELRQFTEAGVPLLQSLADQIREVEGRTISLSEVFSRISKKQIPFEMVEEAFRRMTDEGGKFYNMQEVLVNTLQGKIGKLRDVWQQMLYDMGSSNDTLKWSVDLLTRLVSNFDKIAQTIAPLVAAWGTYKVALAACVSIQKALLGAETIAGMLKLTKATNALGKAIGAIGAKAIGISAAAGVIALLGTAVYVVASKMKKAREEQEKYNKAVANCTRLISDEFDNLDRLKKVAEDETRSMTERKNAIDTINQQYGSYLSNMGQEKVSVDNLTTSYNNLRDAIANKFLDELKEQTVGAERTNKNNAENALLQYNIGLIKKAVGGEPRKLARLTAEVQKYLSNIAPNSTQQNILLKLSEIYSSEGLNIEDDSAKINKLAEDYVNASERLKNSEKNFDSFADEYTKSMGTVRKTTSEVQKQDDFTPSVWGDNKGKDNKAIQKAKDDINTTIDSIKELQRAYKDFKEMGLDDESILQLFGREDMFGYLNKDLRTSLDFWDMLLKQAEKMEQYDQNDAQRIRADVARGKADEAKQAWKEEQKELENAKKALEAYQSAFKKANVKDFNVGGSGALGDAKDALADYNTELNKLENTFVELNDKARKSYANDKKGLGWALDANKGWFDAAKNAQMELLKKRAADSLAQKIFDDQMKGYDLSNWDDKSLEEINRIKNAIDNLSIPKEIQEVFEEYPDILKIIDASLEAIKKKTLDKTVKPKEIEKWAKNAKKAAEYISKAGDAMQRLGKATNDANLEDAGKALSAIGQNLSAAADGYSKSGSWIGAVVGGVLDLFNQITDAVSESNEKLKEMEDTILRIRIASEQNRFEELLSGGVHSIFGDNFNKQLSNAIDGLKEAESKLSEIEKKRRSFFEWVFMQDWKPGHAMSDTADKILAGLDTPDIGDMKFVTDHSFWSGNTYKTLAEIAKDFNMTITDLNGNLNPKLLQEILNTYGDLNEGAKEWLNGAIEYADEYEKAMKIVHDTMEDIFGDIASGMADNIIDSWIEAGNAALDYADILDGVARSYAKMLIQSTIMKTFLDPITEDLEKAFMENRYEDAMSMIAEAMDGVANSAPMFEEILSAFDPYFKHGGSESNSVGSGIKSITEDTANLLASYINAMRSDLSIMRGLQEKGWGYIESFGASLPTLNDYIAQIAATNFDIAQSNQSILSEIQSVIGAPGTSGMVVRVEAS